MNLDVHRAVLQNKDTETGCTLHEVTDQVDCGSILMQKKISIVRYLQISLLPAIVPDLETPETLREKVQKLEQECFLEALQSVVKGWKKHVT